MSMKFFEFLIEKLSNPSPSKTENRMDPSGVILVAGATGGVGRRVYDILRSKGYTVKVLVFFLVLILYTCKYVMSPSDMLMLSKLNKRNCET